MHIEVGGGHMPKIIGDSPQGRGLRATRMKQRSKLQSTGRKAFVSQNGSSAGRKSRGHTELQSSQPEPPFRRTLFVLCSLAAFLLAVYLMLPDSFADRRHSDNDNSPDTESENCVDCGEADSGISCEVLMSEAKYILDNKPRKEWEHALDLLQICALQELDNPLPRWNLVAALVQLGRTEEAVEFIDQALTLDPTNSDYLKTGGTFLAQNGYHDEAVVCLELFLALSLRTSWDQLLASISIQREDEWVFLYRDVGEDVVSVFEVLLASYLKTKALIKSGYLYKVIIGLQGVDVDPELLFAYSSFSFGLGDIATGIKYHRTYMEMKYINEGYGDLEQAYEVITAHSLRLLTAGTDTHISSIARNLLMSGELVWDELVYNCNLGEADVIHYDSFVRRTDLRRLFIKCLLVQNVIQQLLQDGAVEYTANIFGWNPILQLAALGSSEAVSQLLAHRADPQSRTVLAHTALHVAAIRGSYEVVSPLLQAGLRAGDEDYFNRTALDVACLHNWSAKPFASALGVSLPDGCPTKPKQAPLLKHSPQGGWLGSGVKLPEQLTTDRCDFDILEEVDVNSFTFNFLSLERPVLIRNAAKMPEIKRLLQLWQRSKFEQEYGNLEVTEVDVPFAESFGYSTSTATTIRAFLSKLKQQHKEYKETESPNSLSHSKCIFENVNLYSPLLKNLQNLTFLNPDIGVTKMQFHLGPALSGFPLHFRKSSWNLLVYGESRWFLHPPDRTIYSSQHPWDWWRREYSEQQSSGALECVQRSGEVLFVPEMWGQASLSLRESVGVTAEFVYGSSEFSI